ncbi:MAG: hypothetical protein IIX80_01465 [Clostridia bacterium]|nr:hypothetical protein [Clostridia bacterium]
MAFLKSCIYVLAIGIASHFVGEALPRRWFCWDAFPYRAWKWEKEGKIYDRLRIRAWKDHLPDMSRVMKDMIPKRVGTCPTSERIYILIRETCVAECIHALLCICSIVIYFFWRNGIGIFLAVLSVLCNLPFILIQRYNRPALVALAERLERREERKRNACTSSVS